MILLGVLLAVACAAATNLAFLYKHRGACAVPTVDFRRPLRSAKSLFSSRLFAVGMLVAAGAWGLHVAALALAPISLVQAALAAGVVLLAVMAERWFGLRVGTRQWAGLTLTALGLVLLAVTLPSTAGAHARFALAGMIAFEGGLLGLGTLLILGRRLGAAGGYHAPMLAVAAGLLFGVSDIAIKALTGAVGDLGATAFLSPWTGVMAAASVAAFFASARALQDRDAVPVIALTATAANVAGVAAGIVVFGDPLGHDPLGLTLRTIAFALVLGAAALMPAPLRLAPDARPA
jgi:drug/metabolite transporter (DMT)-like permease